MSALGAALRGRPLAWAKYPRPRKSKSALSHSAWLINSADPRAPRAFRSGGFEAAVRDGVLYVRYVGEAL